MAGYTAGRDPLVAHRPCRKGRRALVARLARGSGWDMPCRRFAHDSSGCTVMTARGRTAGRDPRVVIPAATGK
jgi:hypothetical protein